MGVETDSLLLVLPVSFRRDQAGRLLFESQACNGLERWAENFGRLVVACPLAPGVARDGDETSEIYLPVDDLPSRDRIEFITLPTAYRMLAFAKAYRGARAALAAAIPRCQYLCFAIGGLFGDWASVAALEAHRQGRPFSVWTDRVEHQVIKKAYLESRGPRRFLRWVKNNLVISPMMASMERRVVSRADLGLFHGRDCYDGYAPISRRPFVVHNIHTKPEDRIDEAALREKLRRARAGEPLRIVYTGRAAGMKGPLDWVRVLADLHGRGVAFHATWLGDGPLLAEMREEVARHGLADRVDLPGFVGDRRRVMQAMRDSDLFLFCHKTPESPRCLIEALIAASPIVGYDSAFARDLLEDSADLALTPLDDPDALARRVAGFDADRQALVALMERCYELGGHYSDRAVFRHRSELIKTYLGVGDAGRVEAGV
ncbi:glycosyltransferase [Paludisphaera mucosa]|uniref:Glycosyltransferase n=1 Tax=Paludisphaera mucosa TaxID=3030827 RepID=A0ABT6FBK8_9BACT|nr:glycosyltransferase [Paludisphaera mucosa]MDG3004966.1 glycosyltransferase [Paludisphaera mucosa]